MSESRDFKIAYVGGGSQYVIPLLNGLASRSDELKDLGRPIELSLFDRDARKARKNRQYAEIVARESGLPLGATVAASRSEALEGSDWVIFGIGFHDEFKSGELRRHAFSPGSNMKHITSARTTRGRGLHLHPTALEFRRRPQRHLGNQTRREVEKRGLARQRAADPAGRSSTRTCLCPSSNFPENCPPAPFP